MIADLKPYPEYKESGLPWLGQVPRHWDVRPAFGAFVPNHERNDGMKEKTVLSLSYGRIVIKPVEKLHGLVPESFETYQIVNPGDIVLRPTDLQNDHTSLRVGMVRDRGIITSAYLALRVKAGVNPDYGFQFLNVWDGTKAIYGYGSGLRQNLDFSHFKRMPVALPPPAEQAAIVRFVDWANGRLERAIRAKRKVIALLNEQKQAIIHQVVTRGLNASVPLKSAGLPWLGDIPQHWEVRRLKHISPRIGVGLVINPSSYFVDETHRAAVPILLGNNITPNGFRLEKARRIGAHDNRRLIASRLTAGDVVVVRVGAPGVAAVIPPSLDGCNCASVMIVRKHASFVSQWLAHLFNSQVLVSQIDAVKYGAAQKQFNISHAVDFLFPVPPTDEQQGIVDGIAKSTAPLDRALWMAEREIGLLREYRTRLVAYVVTGKLDVREAAARLPLDVAPAVPEDEIDSIDDVDSTDEEAAVV